MTPQEALKNKAECMLAWLRGEVVEVSISAAWFPLTPAVRREGQETPRFDHPGECYRIAPKPEPKMPEGVFWVRAQEDHRLSAYLVTEVTGEGFCIGVSRPYSLIQANEGYYWSHDRKTWFTFTGEKVE